MTDSTSLVEQAREQARLQLQQQQEELARARTLRFLLAQSTILAIATPLAVAQAAAAGNTLLILQSITFCLLVGLVTGIGWWAAKRHGATTERVTTLLYIDVVLGLMFLYVGGEFESAFLGCVFLPIVMAPIFTAKKHAFGLAGVASVTFLALLAARQIDLIPYGYMLDAPEAIKDLDFVADSAIGFIVVTFALAVLAGHASLEILKSNKVLEAKIDLATRRLARANEELAERNRALDEFNAALSHDLKSPLQTALLSAETLLFSQPPLQPKQQELARNIADSADRMGDLVRELLKLSRMEGDLETWDVVDLKGVVDQVQADLQSRVLASSAQVSVQGQLPLTLGNPSLLREAIQNLLENALKYGASDGPQVRVEETPAPWGRIGLAIEDNGPGIPADQRELVFRPFLQLKAARGSEGVGAGLAIVQRIVSVHGGVIRVEEGKALSGARFVLELPKPGTLDTLPH